MIELKKGDCLEELKKIPDKSINLVLTDPPYNIKLADWDTWKSYSEYVAFMLRVFKECERVLVDNGSLYFFHNDLEQIALLMNAIREETAFNFNSFIIWDKGDFRAQAWKYPTENNNLRSWFNTCEYCLYYNKRSGISTEWDRTGLEKVMLDPNNFKTLREYSRKLLEFINPDLSLAKRDILKRVGGCTDHFTRYKSTQWDICTPETYQKIIDAYNLKSWSNFREYESLRQEYESLRQEYESLRQEYESLRFTHNLDPNHKNIMRYKRDGGKNYHPCQKPIELLERLVRCSSHSGEIILDCFMGSGSTGVASINLNRSFIGIERDDKYFEIAKTRIEKAQEDKAQSLFGDFIE